MIPATNAIQRPADAKLLAVDEYGMIRHEARSHLVNLLYPGDLVIANDAATIPASLHGMHLPSSRPIEVRLAGRTSLDHEELKQFSAVVFGEGDFRARTEDRPLPPALRPGDLLRFGSLQATIAAVIGHPRFVSLHFDGSTQQIWEGLARHGSPIQYSHIRKPLALWDTWTAVAGLPAAFEPPSAGFMLDWRTVLAMADRGIGFVTITHAAGLSSTGDARLDARLPFDEPYRIPPSAARVIRAAKARKARIVAIGTSVVRALEHAALRDGTVAAGDGLATQRISADTRLSVVDAIVSGTHDPGTSHYDLLRAFIDDATSRKVDRELESHGYRTHEYGDSVFVQRRRNAASSDVSSQGERFLAAIH